MPIAGSVQVTAPIAPSATTDTYGTHYDIYGIGGYRAVADNAARDAITASRRSQGMLVFVTSTSTFYTLDSNLTTWTVFSGGGGGAASPYDETPSGTVDGSNNVFTLTGTPVTGTLQLFVNGVRQTIGIDFGIVGTTITMSLPPEPGSVLRATYWTTTPGISPTTWGTITGTLSAQVDLQNALNLKVDKSTQPINVKDYGAVGDGTTDDTTAIQNAINVALAGTTYRPSVFFPRGNYKVSSPLSIPIPTVSFEIFGGGTRNPIDGGSGSMITYTGSGTMMTITNGMALFVHDIGFAGSGSAYGAGSSQTCMKWLEVGAGTGMSSYERVTWYGFDTAVQFADSLGMFGCADVGFDFCVVYNCNYGVRVFNMDGCNYIFRRLYANNTNSVISSVPGMFLILSAQFVGCGSATRYAMEFTQPGNNNGAVIIDEVHFEGMTKQLIYFQGGRLDCRGLEEAQAATGTSQITLEAAEVRIQQSRFTSGTPTVPLTNIIDGHSKRPRIVYEQCYFDREIDADTYRAIIGFGTNTSWMSGFKMLDCSATQSGVPIPIVDAGGRVQDGVMHLSCTTTNATPTELTTNGGPGIGHNRIDNQYNYREAEIRVLGLSGGKWCRFQRSIVFTPSSLVSLQKIVEDQDAIGGCSLAITVPDGQGVRLTVTGPSAATCTWWAEARIVSCGLQDSTAIAGSLPTFPSIGLAYHESTHEAGGTDALPWTTIHGRGTTGSKPTASASNAGYLYYDTTLSQLQRSNGTTWDVLTSGGGSVAWGSITGTLSSQTDLNTALGLKYDKAGGPIGTDPGGTELVRIGGTLRASGNYSVFGTTATTGNTTVYVEGGNSGTGGGAIVACRMNGTMHAAFGNYSAMFGGAYDDRAVFYADIGAVIYAPAVTEPNTTSHVIGTDPGGSDLLRVGGSITAGTNVIKGGSLVLGTDPGGSELLRVGGAIHVTGAYGQFGTAASTGQYIAYVDGGDTGTGAGAAMFFRMNSSIRAAIGNYSAIIGGAADNRGLIYATGEMVIHGSFAGSPGTNEVSIGGGSIRISRTTNAGTDEVVRGDDTRLAAWATKSYPADAAGWLNNNGTGTLSWSTPTAAQVGALPASGGTTNYLTIWASSSSLTSSQYLPAANFPALTGDVTSTAGSLATTIASGAVTLSKMANLAANSVIGNNTGSAVTPIALSQTQLTAMVNTFSSSLSGAVPASGGGTTNFLRADGTWAAPAGGGTPAGSNTQIQYNNSGAFGASSAFTYTSSFKLLQNVCTATASGSLWEAIFLRTNWASSGTTSTPLLGAEIGADTSGTGTNTSSVVGTLISAQNANTAGALTQLKGLQVTLNASGNGSSTSIAYGQYITASVGTGHTVTTLYGLYLSQTNNGSITSLYGLYQDSTAALNFFAGPVAVGNATPSASTALITAASTTSVSSLRIPHGSAPTSPVNGDEWSTTGGRYAYINGATVPITKVVLSTATSGGTLAATATYSCYIFTGSSTHTLTLIACYTNAIITIKNRSTGAITINRAGSDTIEGATSYTLAGGSNASVTLIGNGTDWNII